MVSKLRVTEGNLDRTRIRAALIVAVMLALAGLGFVLGRTMVNQQASVAVPEPHDLDPAVSQRIREFRRVKVKDGRKEWELVASEAQFVADQGQVEINAPKLAFYGGEGRDVAVKGAAGRVFLESGEVDRIELSGGIDVTVGEYFVETDKAIYFENINSIAAPGEVRLKSADIALTGQSMLLDLGKRKVLFRNGISTMFKGGSEAGAGPSAAAPKAQVP